MARKFKLPEPEPLEEDDSDIDDPLPALLAGLLLAVSCPACGGTGNGGECQCRVVGYTIAVKVLEDEGIVES